MQEQLSNEDWRNEISSKNATLKVLDGESKVIIFKNEGTKKQSVDYGNSVAFLVREVGSQEDKLFYVKANNFDLLGQIKELGSLTGKTFRLSRTGSKKSDTRYKITTL